jgi:hypothetical protein
MVPRNQFFSGLKRSSKTQKLVILASHVEFPEEISSFKEEKLRKLKDKLDSMASVK